MSVKVRHQFTSLKGDGPDDTLIRPSNWNADHSVELTGPALLGRASSGAGAAAEITLGAGLAFSGSSLKVSQAAIPVGAMLPFAGATAPSGWLLCYGQAVSRTTYAALFAAISTAYGSGNGSSTFNVPDMRGRVAAGRDNMGGTAANRLTTHTGGVDGSARGKAGGEQTHVLTFQELARHDHGGTALAGGAHTHQMFGDVVKSDASPTLGTTDAPAKSNTAAQSYTIQGDTSGNPATLGRTSTSATHTHTIETDDTGNDTPHNNVQPTQIFDMIIYAGV